ncbi:helix-turn-helix transcriptional regulator [Amycolatopsis carbonis]|uniref:Helix-turn-helix transcriptional regulator n=1 Tax=Amycolatopsis carbonis TaxID=715471 RepID=A0A9Y2IJF0_9PSEU|nr:helix-turn-helix transcriptional regulator [Amycolatopsis sp. 2-15]WIX79438.1 helix-turn-helix transcriptional regulator [Amycolatopsis sp. 2-15]
MATTRGMSEQAFFILTALVDAPLHGYGIVGEVKTRSSDRLTLRVGTLYGALDRLTGERLVEPDHDEVINGRLRRYYRLTPDGRTALALEAERQAAIARVAHRRLGLGFAGEASS